MSSGDRRPSDDETTDEGENSDHDERMAGENDSGTSEPIPPRQPTGGNEPLWKQLWTATDGPLLFVRELLLSLAIVGMIGLILFAVSGVWPPMVAVESDSMEPNINKYDLVVVSEPGRYAGEGANEQGLVMAETASGSHESFNSPGSVIVYDTPGRVGSPIIHRVRFAVEDGENWYQRADPDAVNAESCAELETCPAQYAGYITKGDNNEQYDQANGIAPVVRPQWVQGVAQVRIPYLGRLRLVLLGTATNGPSGIASGGTAVAAAGGPAVTTIPTDTAITTATTTAPTTATTTAPTIATNTTPTTTFAESEIQSVGSAGSAGGSVGSPTVSSGTVAG